MELGYFLKRIFDMNYSEFFKKIKSVSKKAGKSRLYIILDIFNCAIKYGSGYTDYDLFEMYNLTPDERDTYITRGRNNALVKKYNDPRYTYYFNNKAVFNKFFSQCIKREWVSLHSNENKVLSFIKTHNEFIVKPLNGTCGKGIFKINTSDYSDAETVYEKLIKKDENFILEELIVQHPKLSKIYPLAINTLRVVTITNSGNTRIICTYFRIGNHSNFVDNFNSEGMVAPVDEIKGIVKDKAIDKNKVLYETHPYSGEEIEGFHFPYWQEAMEMVKNAAKTIPEVGYVGWDVAFTENGPCIVEGNSFPGHDIYQLPEHTPDKRGIYEKFFF